MRLFVLLTTRMGGVPRLPSSAFPRGKIPENLPCVSPLPTHPVTSQCGPPGTHHHSRCPRNHWGSSCDHDFSRWGRRLPRDAAGQRRRGEQHYTQLFQHSDLLWVVVRFCLRGRGCISRAIPALSNSLASSPSEPKRIEGGLSGLSRAGCITKSWLF